MAEKKILKNNDGKILILSSDTSLAYLASEPVSTLSVKNESIIGKVYSFEVEGEAESIEIMADNVKLTEIGG